jgi:hypothetical protein
MRTEGVGRSCSEESWSVRHLWIVEPTEKSKDPVLSDATVAPEATESPSPAGAPPMVTCWSWTAVTLPAWARRAAAVAVVAPTADVTAPEVVVEMVLCEPAAQPTSSSAASGAQGLI